jgi:hypothetical protein
MNGYSAKPILDVISAVADHRSDLVAVGSTRVNGILKEYMELQLDPVRTRATLPYQIDYHCVTVDEDGTKKIYGDRDQGREQAVPVLITRREGILTGAVTIIASNNGRAVQRIGDILTDEVLLQDLFKTPQLAAWGEIMPKRFQILLYVTVHDGGTFPGRPHVEKVWAE